MAIPKKIPTIAAIFLLFFAIGILSAVVQTLSSKKATPSSLEPKNLMVTNITDTTAKIIWQTSISTTGMVTLAAPNKTKITAYDERDVTGKLHTYENHSVSVKNLTPNTSYTITVSSNGKVFTQKDKPLTFQTGPAIMDTTVAGFEPAYGVVKTADGKPASGGIIVLTLDNSQPISTLITPSGSWIMPLNFIRTSNLTSYLPFKDSIVESISIYYNGEKTEAITDINNDSPVPDMTVGSTYDFRNQLTRNKSQSTGLASARTLLSQRQQGNVLGALALINSRSQSKNGAFSITSPPMNGSIVSTRPLIQGTGIPGKVISLSIGITSIQKAKTTVKANGLWQYTPLRPLSYGKQSVTMSSTDANNKTVSLSSVFSVMKSGSQVLGDATPSATLSITPTATVTASTTITPEITSSPTPTEAITAEPIPTTGSTTPTILLIIAAIGLVAGGVFFLL